MKNILSLCLVFVLIACGFCDMRYRGNAINPNYPGQCYYKELEQPIPKNQVFKPINNDDNCLSIRCRPDYVLEIESCGRHNMVANSTCKVVADMRYAYPDCCPKYMCHSENNNI